MFVGYEDKGNKSGLESLDGLSTITYLCLEIHAGATFQQASKKPSHGCALSQADEDLAAQPAERLLRVCSLGGRGLRGCSVQWTEAPMPEEDRAAPHCEQAYSQPLGLLK